VNYKLRDWIFSRQRYWGEPIPVIHLNTEDFSKVPQEKAPTQGLTRVTQEGKEFIYQGANCISQIFPGLDGPYILDTSLPLRLPEVEKYEPSDDGRSPLANVTEWVNIEIVPGLRGTRETNTMPQWAGSCWYYLRFMDPNNSDAIASKEAMEYWGSVDCYVGGAEHAVLHLLYARFWHKVLHDIGVVPTREPFQKLVNQGLILGPDGNKMSKSKGNVVNPDDIVKEFGADTLRTYILSMADFKDPAPWDTRAMVGMQRFLERSEALFGDRPRLASDEMKSMKLLHKTIKKVGEDIQAFKFNTAISALIILVNEGLPTDREFQVEWKTAFTLLLHPFAPHLAEELWSQLSHTESIYRAPWPEFDSFMTIDDEVTIAIQVNGKLRGTKEFLNGVAAEEVISEAYSMPEITKWTEGKKVIREIFVPNKLLNIVVQDN
jgi:leucyl-tRNA synthetase